MGIIAWKSKCCVTTSDCTTHRASHGSKGIALPVRLFGLSLLVLLMSSCFGSKKTTIPPSSPKPTRPIETIDSVAVVEQMDTMKWTDVDTLSAPVLVKDDPNLSTTSQTDLDDKPERFFKDQYHIAVLLPFFTQDSAAYLNNRPASWSLDFYLGFKLALQKAPAGKGRFTVHTFDTKANPDVLERIIEKGSLDLKDIIIGPYRSNLVTRVAEYVRDKPTLMISPYSASGRIGKENPHYLQLNPALESHMRTTWKYLKQEKATTNPVVFIHGKSESEVSKKQLWQSWVDSLPPKNRKRYTFKEIDETGDMAMDGFQIDSLLQEGVLNNIVFPSWDETHVQAIMSKMSSRIATKSVRLFGLPQWIGFERISPSYFESLQVHLTSTDFVDDQDPEIRSLKTRFKNAYAQPLSFEAVWGYRCGIFVVNALANEGALFHRFLQPDHPMVYSKDCPQFVVERSPDGGFLRIENQNIVMLKFADGRMVEAND